MRNKEEEVQLLDRLDTERRVRVCPEFNLISTSEKSPPDLLWGLLNPLFRVGPVLLSIRR